MAIGSYFSVDTGRRSERLISIWTLCDIDSGISGIFAVDIDSDSYTTRDQLAYISSEFHSQDNSAMPGA